MSGTWIAKPLSALTPHERSLFRGIAGPMHPLSQTLEWASALESAPGVSFLVFSPERKVSAVFLITGDRAECVNGPVLHWPGIVSAKDLNEQVSMVVYALHQGNPALRAVRIRPRLLQEQFQFLEANLAFPVDRVEQARTMILDLSESEEEQWKILPARIRSEVSRAIRKGVRVFTNETESGISRFWAMTRDFYQARGLFVPNEEWIRSLLLGDSDANLGFSVITALHAESESESEILLVTCGGTGIYFFAHERRSASCPGISLNLCAQWEAMKICIRSGVKTYDLNGIAVPGSAGNETFAGVDSYKRKFKGREVLYYNPLVCFGDSRLFAQDLEG